MSDLQEYPKPRLKLHYKEDNIVFREAKEGVGRLIKVLYRFIKVQAGLLRFKKVKKANKGL